MTSTPTISAEQLLAHSEWARALARRLVTDAATADDVVQETWIAALRTQPDAGSRSLRPWLERVLRNFASKERRAHKTRRQNETNAVDPRATSAPVADVVARAEGQQRVVAAVLALAEPYRSVVLLRYYEGLSAAEIARRTDTPAGTVRWQLSTGLGQLRRRLDDDADGDTRAWCTALLPLAGLSSLEAAAGAAATGGASAARSSFVSILQGVAMMKVVWSIGAAAFGAVLLFLLYQLGTGLPMAPTGASGSTTAEVATKSPPNPQVPNPQVPNPQVYVRRDATVTPTARPVDQAAAPRWHATVLARFVDAQGLPVAGVATRFPRHDPVLSDASGRVAVAVPKPFGNRRRHGASLSIVATAGGFANVHREVSAALLRGDGDAIELGDVVLEAGGSIEGTVVDATGRPVERAHVSVDGRSEGTARTTNLLAAVPMSRNRVGPGSAETDADGRYRISGLLLGSNRVEVSYHPDDSFVDELWCESRVQVAAPGTTTTLDLKLARRYAERDVLTVLVVSPDGEPVPHASVEAQSSRGNSRTSSNADGIARCAFANAGRTVDLTITAPDNRYAPIVHEGAALGETVTIRFAKAIPLPITLTSDAGRALGSVDIRLTTVASGGLFGFGGTPATELLDDSYAVGPADGAVTGLVVPAERFVVEIEAHGHELGRFGPYTPQEGERGLELQLAASPMAAGRVTDGDGRAVAGATVALHRRPERKMTYNGFRVWLDPQAIERAVTDDAGRFELTVRGERSFFLRASADGFAATMTGELQVMDIAESVDIDLHQGGILTGSVATAAGVPAAGSIVVANRGDGFAVTTRVGADGAYRFEQLTPGPYRIELTGSDINPDESSWRTTFGSSPRALESPNCSVVAGAETRFDIGPAHALDARLRGHIELAGWSLEGRRIAIEPADVAEGRTAPERWHATIDVDGRFDVPALPSAAVLLRIADGTGLIEARLDLVPGDNHFDLTVETRDITLRELPRTNADGSEVMVVARWQRGNTTIQRPVAVARDGTANVSLPVGTVALERSPTEADLGALMAAGGFTFVPLREIRVE